MTKTILAANTGGIGPIAIGVLANAQTITSVRVDTTGLKKTSVLLNYTSQINMPGTAAVALTFNITKSIDGGAAQSMGTWGFGQTTAATLESEAFSFQFFDANTDEGNCIYTVQLAAGSNPGAVAGVNITNATLSLIAVGEEKVKEEKVGEKTCKGKQN